VKKPEEVMEILEAYDLAGTLRGAAALAGCDHKTVAYWYHRRTRQLRARASDRRQGGEAPRLTRSHTPDGGEIRGHHQRGEKMAPVGNFVAASGGKTDGH